jgi:hypothetical protein
VKVVVRIAAEQRGRSITDAAIAALVAASAIWETLSRIALRTMAHVLQPWRRARRAFERSWHSHGTDALVWGLVPVVAVVVGVLVGRV